MALIKLNRHLYHVPVNNIAIKAVSAGRWEVTFDRVVASDGEVLDEGATFLVVGGRQSGGSSREWFCYRPSMYGEQWVPCTSKIAAIRLGCSY